MVVFANPETIRGLVSCPSTPSAEWLAEREGKRLWEFQIDAPILTRGADSEFVGVFSPREIEELQVLERSFRPRRARLGGAVIDNSNKMWTSSFR